MNKLLFSLLFICVTYWCYSCNSETEKYQNKRNNVINVRDRITEIVIEDVFISDVSEAFIVNDYLFIYDLKAYDKLIHLFDKNNFEYLTSTARKGGGPGEIVNLAFIAPDEKNRKFYATDFGKRRIFSYDLDSVLVNPSYMPDVKAVITQANLPSQYLYISDTLCIGNVLQRTSNSNFTSYIAKWNMLTGEIEPMKYAHPSSSIEWKRTSFAVSTEHGIYVECYKLNDLMTICSLDGELRYNIYGSKWNKRYNQIVRFYGKVEFCKDKIVALYASGMNNFPDKNGVITYQTQFLVFDINGNYLQTLETDYEIMAFCYDETNNRIIMTLGEMIQIAYLDLDGII